MRRSLKKVIVFVSVALALAAMPVSAASPLWAPPALNQLIEEGLARSKGLQSLAVEAAGLREAVPFEGSLDDPRLGVGLLNLPANSFDFDQEPMTQKQIFLTQKVPWFGKLNLKEQRQLLKADQKLAILEAKRMELARKIATTYYELGFASSGLEINGRLSGMMEEILKVAETKYATGSGLQQDVLQAQVELSKLIDERIILRKKHRTLEARINELLNREGFVHVEPPGNPGFREMRLDMEILKERSMKQNPWLKVRQAEVDQASVEIQLAKKDYWPDMDFRVAYGQRDESRTGVDWPDFLSASVVVNIPLWQRTRQDKKLSWKTKSREAAENSLASLREALPHRVDALVTEILDTQESYRLFSGALLLQAEQWARSALSAYVVNKVEFSTVINAHIRLLRLELKSKRYLFDVYQKRAELEETLGGPLESPFVKAE